MSLTVKILEKQSGTLTKTAHAWLGGLITSETTGYTSVNATITHNTTTHRWRVVGTGGTSVSLQYDTAVACSVGDVIFTTARVRVLTDGVDNIYARVDGTTAGSLSVASQASPVNGTYYDLYGTATITASETGNIRLRWWFYDASGATDTVMQVERWTAINLTDQFGAGDEPSAADLQAFFEWRWELMSYPNRDLYHATYGDFYHFASKIASHGLEYNDIVKYTYNDGMVDNYYVSPVYPLNDDWIITQMSNVSGEIPDSSFSDNNDFDYWTKTDYTSSVRTKTLQINIREDIEASAAMSFNCTSAWQPELGMTVIIEDGAETLFTGHISSINKTKLSFGKWKADVTVSPLIASLQWIVFPYTTINVESFFAAAGGSTARVLLEILMSSTSGYPLAYTGGQGIWLGSIDDGNTVVSPPDMRFKTLYELFNSTCASSGLVLMMTADRRIKCIDQDITPATAPRNISDAAETNISDITYTESMTEYGNLGVLRGGYDTDGAPVVVTSAATTPPVTDAVYGGLASKAIILSDNMITNTTDAIAATEKIIDRYGLVIPGTLQFTTRYTDFRPGQKIEVDLDDWGIASTKTMHIDNVLMYAGEGELIFCTVTCSNRSASSFAAAPNKGSTAYMTDLSNKVTQSVSALTQSAGSFTPTLYGATTAGTWAYTTQEGYYIRIGNVCYISIRLNPSSISGAVGSLLVGGLPFAASSAATRYHLSAFATGLAWGTSMTQLQMPVTGGKQFGYLYGSANNAAWTVVGVADITTGDEIRISGVYLV